MRLPLAGQITYECFSSTPVPQTDLKHLNPKSLLDKAWLSPRLSLGGKAQIAICFARHRLLSKSVSEDDITALYFAPVKSLRLK